MKNVGPQRVDVLASRGHGTGVLAAAVSRTTGSAPEMIYVLVVGDFASSWDWVAEQPWIDLATTSTYAVLGGGNSGGVLADATCATAPGVRKTVSAGKPVFVAASNGEPDAHLSAPAVLPEVIKVGGVDEAGFPEPDVTRPYEYGDLLSFADAASDTDDKARRGYRGTSFTAPRAAGRAARLISSARRLVGDQGTGVRGGRLVVAGKGAALPRRGPLMDGFLTADELRTLLQDTATPALPPAAVRYEAEGFGALGDTQGELALAVLAGKLAAPDRSAERAGHARQQLLRSSASTAPRCS